MAARHLTMTDEEISRIHATLDETKGDRKGASEILGMTVDDLKIAIKEDPNLRMRWSSVDGGIRPPSELASISRTVTQEDDEAVAKEWQKEDEKARQGLESLLMSEAEIDFAEGCRKYAMNNMRTALDIATGSATRTSVLLAMEVTPIKARLAVVREKLHAMGHDLGQIFEFGGVERKFWVDEERSLVQQLASMNHGVIEAQRSSFDAAKITAGIVMKKTQKPAKPGFVTPDIEV